METIDEMTEMMDRLRDTNDVEAIFYMGAVEMLRDLWLDGGDAADVAVEKFQEMRSEWLDEWVTSERRVSDMPFTFTFTDKEVSIIEEALEHHLDRAFGYPGQEEPPWSKYDVAELSAKITERIAW